MRLRKSGAWDKAGRRGRTFIALAVTAVAGLAACSSVPKAVNPVELYRSAAGFTLNDDTSGERNAQNLAAGSNEPYPNLGTVPPPPDRAMSSIDRQKLQQGLTEDRTEAKRSDADLRGSGTAMAAPTPITRTPAALGDAVPAETRSKGESSLPGAHARANGAHRAPAGSEPAPQESALNSPDVRAIPEGDTPRPAPPPPYLPAPEKARKPSSAQADKSAPGATAAKRPARPPQTAAEAPPAPAAAPPLAAAPVASAPPPPPPPGDVAMPPPNSVAAVPPVTPAPLEPVPSLYPSTPTATPDAASPASRAASDQQKLTPEQMAALDPARSPLPVVPVPAPAQTPTQQATPSPSPQATPTVIPPPAPVDTPEQQAALPSPQATPTIIPPPAPVDTPDQKVALPSPQATPMVVPPPAPVSAPEQQAALPPPPQAMPPASPSDQAMAPTSQRTGRGGTVSLQAAEIDFANNGMTLTAEDDRRLAGVVKLYDKHGGIVRVVGYGRRGFGADAAQQELASFSKAIERANVVARALAQLGLASNRIVVQAAPVGDGLGEDRAEVLIEF